MVVMMRVIVVVVVVVLMMVVMRGVQPAGPGAERIAERAIGHVRARRRGALPLDMVVMTLLRGADLGLEAQHLGAVLAHGAVRGRGLAHLFGGVALTNPGTNYIGWSLR